MELFPVSIRALTTFVSQAQSPRVIGFGDLDVYLYDAFNMSSDQWQALLCHCNGNVKLRVDIGSSLVEDVLIDALNHHQCPAKLFLFHMDHAASVARVAALAQNTSVVELQLDFSGPIGTHHEHRHLILGTGIANNRGLRKLNLSLFHMDDEDWECLWNVVASHPTIESLILDDFSSFHPLSAAKSTAKQRADVMLQALCCNTCVLRELECNYQTLFQLHDDNNDNDDLGQRALSELVRAALELNRWRPRLLAIRRETSVTRRERWFVESLVVVVVFVAQRDQQQALSRENLSFLFLLLNENPELLERSILAKRRHGR
jgi:hypothetical protein